MRIETNQQLKNVEVSEMVNILETKYEGTKVRN